MPTLADAVKLLKVGDKTFDSPQWWSTQHKLKKHTKYNEVVKKVAQKANFGINYRVVTLENQPTVDEYVSMMASKMEYPAYKEYAPWNPAFRKSKTIITF
jgi:hypothetical protein